MAASDHLNGPLFHGTSQKFKVGDVILPAETAGVRQNWGAKSKNDPKLAYATDQLDSAKYYARVSQSLAETRDPESGPKAHVYQVEPVNPEEARWVDTKFGKESLRQHVSSEGYRVVKRHWTDRKTK